MKLKHLESIVLHRPLVLSLVALLTLSGVACKPRSESNLAAAKAAKSGSTTQVPRSIVATLGTEDSDCKVKATKFANWAKYWSAPNAVTEKVESPEPAHLTAVNAVAVKLHSTAGSHIEWLKTAKEVSKSGDRKAGQTSVDTGELDSTIQIYEEVQVTLKPLLDSQQWSRWDATFGEKVRKAFSLSADAYEATLDIVTKWKPTDDDKALDALEAAQAQGAVLNVKPPEATGAAAQGPASGQKAVPDEPLGTSEQPIDATQPTAQPAQKQLPKKSAQQLAQEAWQREQEILKQKQEEERRRIEEERRKIEEQRLAWLDFVTGAERALSEGNGSGTYPTIEQVEAAIKATEAQRAYACNDGKPGNTCRGRPLIDLLSKVNAIAGLYSDQAGVSEGYTVQEHTERVLAVYFDQRDKYGYPESNNRYKILLPVVVALHDIGKPVAVRTSGSTEAQHEHNAKIMGGVLRSIGFTEAEVRVGRTLVSGDILGNHVKNRRHASYTYPVLVSAANQAGINKLEYIRLLRVEYIADAASYPSIAGNFYQEQGGRLNNQYLDALYGTVKATEEREIAEKLAAEKAARDKIEAARLAAEKAERDRIAAEKAAAEKAAAEKAAAEKSAQQANVEKDLKEDNGTDMGPAGEQSALDQKKTGDQADQGAQQAATETKPAEKATPAAPAQPDPPFVGRKYVNWNTGFEFLTSNKCRYYWDRRQQPGTFANCTWAMPSTNQISLTYDSQNGPATLTLQYRSPEQMIWVTRNNGNLVMQAN